MLDQLLTDRRVPVFYHDSPEVSEGVLRAAYAAGLRCFEFTNRGPSARTTFAHLSQVAARDLPGMVLGIGTILNARDVTDFVAVGAQFVVAPSVSQAVGNACQTAGVPWVPGCMTITEMHQALDAGASALKLFPGDVLGTAFVRSARVIFPHVRLMVTGGVRPTADSFGQWFGAGIDAVGMGTHLFPANAVQQNDYVTIQQTIENALRQLTAL